MSVNIIARVERDRVVEVTAPPVEPLTVDEAAQHLRLSMSPLEEPAVLAACITASREYAEKFTGQTFVQRQLRADMWGPNGQITCIDLPRGPVQSIDSIQYYDSDNTLQTWSSGEYYLLHGRVYLNSDYAWPSTYTRPDAFQITYTAGYAATGSPLDYVANIPESLVAAVRLMVGDLYENREGQWIGFVANKNTTWDRLLNTHRLWR